MDIDAKKKTIILSMIILINVVMIVCTSISVFKSIKRTLNGEVKVAAKEDIDENEEGTTDTEGNTVSEEEITISNETTQLESGSTTDPIESVKQKINFKDILGAIDAGIILNLVIIVIGIVLIVVGVVLIVKIQKAQ